MAPLLLLLLLSPFIPTIIGGENDDQFARTMYIAETSITTLRQNLTHLHFYFHDTVSGPNATAVPVTKPPNPSSLFGVITMMDDLLTSGPDPKSPPVGRAQGMYAVAAQQSSDSCRP